MRKFGWIAVVSVLVALAACVTINVYFPAAAAERAADRIIDDVWGTSGSSERAPQRRDERASLAGALLDFLIPPAAAQARPDLDASSPEVRRLTRAMETRHADLRAHYESGAVGLTNDGFIAIRDASQVPLAQRNTVRGLVNEENADRSALYREIAIANGQPQWQDDIRGVFAERWIARAQTGWWVQDNDGEWRQK